MFELFRKNPRYLFGAIAVHLFFIVLFGVGFHFKSEQRASTATAQKTIEVKTIDERLVKKELAKLKANDDREKRRKEELIKKRKAEERQLKKLREQRQTEQKKEKQRLALLEKKQHDLKEKQRKEEARLAELERKRREEEEKADKLKREQALRERMLAEEQRMKAEQEAAALRAQELKKRQTEIDKYMNRIEAKIYQYWIKPPGANKGMVSELRVKLIPTGDVITIELVKSSGDKVFDKSVETAVRSASPLPLPPPESGLFDVFRDLRLPMRADKKT